MAEFKPYIVPFNLLDTIPIVKGQFILTTNPQYLYVDIDETNRVLVNEKEAYAPSTYFQQDEPIAAYTRRCMVSYRKL